MSLESRTWKVQSRFYPGDLMTRTGDREIRSVSGRLPDNPGELARMRKTEHWWRRGSKMSAPSTSDSTVELRLRVIDVRYGYFTLFYFIFKLVFCIHYELHLHANREWRYFPRSNPLRSCRSVLNVSNGGPWNPKLTLKANSLWIKICQAGVEQTHFQNLKKKRKWFFDHSAT